jgi:hypothetical protein
MSRRSKNAARRHFALEQLHSERGLSISVRRLDGSGEKPKPKPFEKPF